MNIFDQAMEIEKEGEELYEKFSQEAPNQGMRYIFSWLADQERKHRDIFKKLKEGKPASVAESVPLQNIKEIFEDWRESATCIEADTSQADVYRRALDIEIKSISIYQKYAATAASPQKEIFLRIAAEEKGHKKIVENIIEFVTKPEVWAENAEFSNLGGDYYL